MALYTPPVNPTTDTRTPAQRNADQIKQRISALGDTVADQYAQIKATITQEGATRADVLAALGTDAAALTTVATKLRALLAAIDSALATKFDATGTL